MNLEQFNSFAVNRLTGLVFVETPDDPPHLELPLAQSSAICVFQTTPAIMELLPQALVDYYKETYPEFGTNCFFMSAFLRGTRVTDEHAIQNVFTVRRRYSSGFLGSQQAMYASWEDLRETWQHQSDAQESWRGHYLALQRESLKTPQARLKAAQAALVELHARRETRRAS